METWIFFHREKTHDIFNKITEKYQLKWKARKCYLRASVTPGVQAMDMVFPGGGLPGKLPDQCSNSMWRDSTSLQDHQRGERLKTRSQTLAIFTSSGDNPAQPSAEDGPGKISGNERRWKPSNHFPSSSIAPILHCILIFLQDWSQLVLSSHCRRQRLGARRGVFPHNPQSCTSLKM